MGIRGRPVPYPWVGAGFGAMLLSVSWLTGAYSCNVNENFDIANDEREGHNDWIVKYGWYISPFYSKVPLKQKLFFFQFYFKNYFIKCCFKVPLQFGSECR